MTNKVWTGSTQPTCPGNGWKVISGDLTGANCNSGMMLSVLSAVAVAPSDLNTVYVGSGTGTVSVSANATSAQPAWRSQFLSCSQPVGAIAVDPANPKIAYATLQGFMGGGDQHVYASTDGGGSWHAAGNGLPAAAVLQLKLASGNGTPTLIAATHGRGAWAIPAAAPPNFILLVDQTNDQIPIFNPQLQFSLHVKLINGNTSPVQIQCSPADSQTTCSLSSSTASADGDITVTANFPAVMAGAYTLKLSGSDGTHRHQILVSVVVEDFQVTIDKSNAINLEYGSSVTILVRIFSMSDWNVAVKLTYPGLPAGFTCTASPASFSSLPFGDTQATMTVTAAANATAQSPL